MRDIVVTLLFAHFARHALRSPYVGALLWVWIGLMNPHRLGWGFAYSLPFGMASAAILLIGMLMHSKEVRWPKGVQLPLLIALISWMGLTTVTAIHVGPSLSKYVEVLKVLGVTILVACVVINRKQIIGLIWVVTGSIAFFGIKGGVFTLLTGGAHRVWGPPSSLVNGNNELALALVISIPLLYFLSRNLSISSDLAIIGRVPVRYLKRGLQVSIFLCAIAAVGSQSRGAFLAIGAMGAMLWWRSKSKLGLGILILLMVPAILVFMPDEWTARMNTIQTYQQDRSAMGRINAWSVAINIANDRFLGAGFATATRVIYAMYAPDPDYVLVAHSIYFQMLGEHGYFGLFLYLMFWFSTYRMAGRLMAHGMRDPTLEWVGELGSMAKVSLTGFAVGAAFLSLAYWDMPFYIMVILLVTENWVRQQNAERSYSTSVEDGASMGLQLDGGAADVRARPSSC
ncbi:MAG: putative O-glycosylation ligase, exosortase A system-associated [Rhodocyclaceae bacterium]|nr:putative O-glycosylation ligase, exosortase A system-associated [Rhodocyclaceae bacterium]